MPSLEEQALLKALESKLDSASAAQLFTKSTTEAFLAGSETEEGLGKAWDTFLNVAANTSHEAQKPLVEVLQAVQQEDVSGKNSKKYEIWGEKLELWQDLPLFGTRTREAWNKAPATGDSFELSADQWINLNAFIARITALSDEIPSFDYSLYAIWTLRAAFENDRKASEADLGAAKVWFSYAKNFIEKLSKEGKSFDGKLARAGEKYSDREWKGLNNERLEIWRASLR